MRKALWLIVVLCLATTMTAQTTPPNYTLKNGLAEWKGQDRTVDEVWGAITKTLMQMKWHIVSADRPSGTLTARKMVPSYASWTGLKEDAMPGVNIVVTAAEKSIDILAQWQDPRGAGVPFVSYKKDQEKFFKAFFSDLAEALK